MFRIDQGLRPYVVLLLGVVVTFLSINADINSWKATLWVIDYDNEFIKRGFVGEVLQVINAPIFSRIESINILCKSLLYFYAIILSLFVLRFYKDNVALGCGLLLAGFSIQQFTYDLGRFDVINQLITLLVIMAISGLRRSLSVPVAIVGSVVMLAVHEASAFICIPLIFAVLFFLSVNAGVADKARSFIYLAVCVFAFALIYIYGGLDLQTFQQWQAYMYARPVDFPVEEGALQVLDTSFSHNVHISIERLLSMSTMSRMFRVLLVSSVTITIMLKTYKAIKICYPQYVALLVFLPVASVLPMFLLGIDFYRWVAALQLNYFLLLGVLIHHQGIKIDLGRCWLIAWFVFLIYGGPFGVTVALPDRNRLLDSMLGGAGLF